MTDKIYKEIWVLDDGRPGNTNQALGLALELNSHVVVKKIIFTDAVKLPNIIRGKTLVGVNREASDVLQPPWPALIIAAGRRVVPVARFIKKASGKKSKLVHIMRPDAGLAEFDLLIIPEHDKIKPRENLIFSVGALGKINLTLLEQEKARWQEKFATLPGYKIAVIIGGNTKKGKFTIEHAKQLFKRLQTSVLLQESNKASLLVTTSRRTDRKVVEYIRNILSKNSYFYDYTLGEENPYIGFLSLADFIVVTGDSISMCSECCSTGKPVYIFSPQGIIDKKFLSFHESLYKRSCARDFISSDLVHFSYDALDETKRIAEAIRKKKFID